MATSHQTTNLGVIDSNPVGRTGQDRDENWQIILSILFYLFYLSALFGVHAASPSRISFR